ncbi:MAG: hypothetical protein LBT80_05090 [Lactobacillaceae bacterium]|jgi:YVTN family beta-propeller protein|nr:hypothetical protein [Lactobacillaceae bacterium]
MKKISQQVGVVMVLITMILGCFGLNGHAANHNLTKYITKQADPAWSVQAANGLLYTANAGENSGNVSVINLKTQKLIKVINLGNDVKHNNLTDVHYCLADGQYVYAITAMHGRVYVINTKTNQVVKQIKTVGNDINYDSANIDLSRHHMYIGREDNKIDVLNTQTQKFEAPISTASLLQGTGMDRGEVQALEVAGHTLYFGILVSSTSQYGFTSCIVGEYNLYTHHLQRYLFPGVAGETKPTPTLVSAQGIEGLAVVEDQQGNPFLYVTSNIAQGELDIFDLTSKHVVATYNNFKKTLPGRVFGMVNLPNNRVGVGEMDSDGAHMLTFDATKNSGKGGKLVSNVVVIPGRANAGCVTWFLANGGSQIVAPDLNSSDGNIWVFDRPSS